MNKQDKIYVAGHRGLVGSAIVNVLKKNGYKAAFFNTSGENPFFIDQFGLNLSVIEGGIDVEESSLRVLDERGARAVLHEGVEPATVELGERRVGV